MTPELDEGEWSPLDAEELAEADALTEQLHVLFEGNALMIVAAALGRVIGEQLDTAEVVQRFFLTMCQVAADHATCTCPNCRPTLH